jgi:cell division protein FtsB
LNRGGNTNWLSNRQVTHRVAVQTLPSTGLRDFTEDLLPVTIRSFGMVPSWIFLAMILLATLGICTTVILRSRAELKSSAFQHNQIASEIETMRRSNTSLEIDIRRMTADPGFIETAARDRLGMVRANDIVVPIEALQSASRTRTLSFVR